MPRVVEAKRSFRRIAAAGVFFQGGAAAIDSATIISALVHQLTGSVVAVGAAATIARAGWLVPQLFVGYAAQRSERRMPYYLAGAVGRAVCLAALGLVLWFSTNLTLVALSGIFFVLWTMYSLIGGIVAVPYNDIVARSVTSGRRSRLLAIRFFGGGLLALGVAAIAHVLLGALPFPNGFAALLLVGAMLLFSSAMLFVSAGEPPLAANPSTKPPDFVAFLKTGIAAFRFDRRFRLFVCTQWLGGVTSMALPFYVLETEAASGSMALTAVLLGFLTAGALLSNAVWGWWGDHLGKLSLLTAVAMLSMVPPVLTLAWIGIEPPVSSEVWFATVFVILGATGNGATIAQLGYLMEISPEAQRPAYSGYFNALIAPASLFPLVGAYIVRSTSLSAVFVASTLAVLLQVLVVRCLHREKEQ